MRTKALLGAALVAASTICAMAQTDVYSLNIVGYANVSADAGYSILANPLSAGATNGANEVLPPVDGMVVLPYVGGVYQYFGYDTGAWINELGDPTNPPMIPPGVGFFYFNPGATAQNITFVGQVVPLPGVTNSMSVAAGYSLVGSPMPVGGPLPAAANNMGIPVTRGAINMPIWDGLTLLPYVGGVYQYFGFDGGWVDETGTPRAVPPSIAIGQGFFFFNPEAGPVNWLQALP